MLTRTRIQNAARGHLSGLNRGLPLWPEAGSRRQTGLMQLGQMMKRPQRLHAHPQPAARPSPEPDRLSISDIGTDLAEKADPAMYEDDQDRTDAAEQLTEHNPHAAAQAFSAIACDQTVDDETRLAAAEQLAAIDPQAAAPACLAIASDKMVSDEVRLAAAEQLAAIDPRGAAPACVAIAINIWPRCAAVLRAKIVLAGGGRGVPNAPDRAERCGYQRQYRAQVAGPVRRRGRGRVDGRPTSGRPRLYLAGDRASRWWPPRPRGRRGPKSTWSHRAHRRTPRR